MAIRKILLPLTGTAAATVVELADPVAPPDCHWSLARAFPGGPSTVTCTSLNSTGTAASEVGAAAATGGGGANPGRGTA